MFKWKDYLSFICAVLTTWFHYLACLFSYSSFKTVNTVSLMQKGDIDNNALSLKESTLK